jgi:hypothetical protein
MCKSGILFGKHEQIVLSNDNQKEIVYFEIELKENVYQYISQDKQDTVTLVIENNKLYELGYSDDKKIRIIE